MISITDDASFDRALDQVRCAALRDLIERRRAILDTDLPFADMAQFIVVHPHLRLRTRNPGRWRQDLCLSLY